MSGLDGLSLDADGFVDMDQFPDDGSDLGAGDLDALRAVLHADPVDEPTDDHWHAMFDSVVAGADDGPFSLEGLPGADGFDDASAGGHDHGLDAMAAHAELDDHRSDGHVDHDDHPSPADHGHDDHGHDDLGVVDHHHHDLGLDLDGDGIVDAFDHDDALDHDGALHDAFDTTHDDAVHHDAVDDGLFGHDATELAADHGHDDVFAVDPVDHLPDGGVHHDLEDLL